MNGSVPCLSLEEQKLNYLKPEGNFLDCSVTRIIYGVAAILE